MHQKIRQVVPNTLTSINLFCGCISVLALLNGYNQLAVSLVLLAAFVDFFDGFAARLLKVTSDLGKELDSLADMVSFGFVPGVIMYLALQKAIGIEGFSNLLKANAYLPFVGFLLTVFSALRLAKFNIDTRQSTSFIGLPTPANTLFFLTIPLIWDAGEAGPSFYQNLLLNEWMLIGLTLLFSYLLVAELPLIAMKFKGFSLKDNWYKYTLFIGGALLVALFGYLSIPLVLGLYIVLSVVVNFTTKSA